MIKKIEPLKIKLTITRNGSLIHDSRSDIRALAKVINRLVEKVDEIVDKLNQMEKEQTNDDGR